MKANEFVKENGVEKCKRILDDLTDQGHNGDFYKELKRLVESHELVKNHKGISPCKFWVSMMDGCDAYQNKVDLFKQAIEDVESCQ